MGSDISSKGVFPSNIYFLSLNPLIITDLDGLCIITYLQCIYQDCRNLKLSQGIFLL